jgi:hypothetical protein
MEILKYLFVFWDSSFIVIYLGTSLLVIFRLVPYLFYFSKFFKRPMPKVLLRLPSALLISVLEVPI